MKFIPVENISDTYRQSYEKTKIFAEIEAFLASDIKAAEVTNFTQSKPSSACLSIKRAADKGKISRKVICPPGQGLYCQYYKTDKG